MSYLALARKWRPRTFSQLVGQEPVNKALINALNQQRLHHAYLFTGTRGVGKTSVARILAKSLNCERGISSEPCLQCNACTSIEQGRFIDLIEIDGASKTRVEDTRELLDNVQYAPTSGRFKIYLIDEVHMLSQHSFNALLKTLEEPPAHVKFILATTDPQKLPVTVLSRCLQFSLRDLPVPLISTHLQHILQDEQLDYELAALDILAQAARGSMRDALSLLDQAITSCDKKLLAQDVKMILGYTQQDYALQLIEALAKQEASQLLVISQQIATEGGHFHYVLDELLNYFHQISILQHLGTSNQFINTSSEINLLAAQFTPEDTQLFYQIGVKGTEEIHLAPSLHIGFNMTLLRMLAFRPAPPMTSGAEISAAPIPTATPVLPLKTLIPEEVPQQTMEEKEEEIPREIPTAPSITKEQEALDVTQDWPAIIPKLKLTGLALNAIENAEFLGKEERTIQLRVARGHQSLFTPTAMTRIETALGEYFKTPIKITLSIEESVQSSPAQQKEQTLQKKQLHAEQALNNDPVFQQLQQEFSAELVKNSIVPLKDDL